MLILGKTHHILTLLIGAPAAHFFLPSLHMKLPHSAVELLHSRKAASLGGNTMGPKSSILGFSPIFGKHLEQLTNISHLGICRTFLFKKPPKERICENFQEGNPFKFYNHPDKKSLSHNVVSGACQKMLPRLIMRKTSAKPCTPAM